MFDSFEMILLFNSIFNSEIISYEFLRVKFAFVQTSTVANLISN